MKKFKAHRITADAQLLSNGPGVFLRGLVERSENCIKTLINDKEINASDAEKWLGICHQ